MYYSRDFPERGRAAARRDVLCAGCCYIASPPSGCGLLPGSGYGEEPGAVVVPAADGLVPPSLEGPVQRGGEAGAGDQPGGVLPGESGEPGGLGDRQRDGGDAGRAGLAAADRDGRVTEGNQRVSVADIAVIRGAAGV